MGYPVRVVVVPPPAPRNRLTTLFRLVLAIPHSILVGPVLWIYRSGSLGLLGAAVYFLAVVNWVGILITRSPVVGIRELTMFYLRWRTRAVAYTALLADAYPPFGDGPYPAEIVVDEPPAPRRRGRIALRPLLVLPHLAALFFILLAWCVTSVLAWFAIVFTGAYPPTLYRFGVGAMGWLLRVEAYVLLLVDEYPPFSLELVDGD